MRSFYLNRDAERGCRGGVSYLDSDHGYELEIGNSCNASPELLAVAILKDEIIELLESNAAKTYFSDKGGHLDSLVLQKYKGLVKKLKNDLDK